MYEHLTVQLKTRPLPSSDQNNREIVLRIMVHVTGKLIFAFTNNISKYIIKVPESIFTTCSPSGYPCTTSVSNTQHSIIK